MKKKTIIETLSNMFDLNGRNSFNFSGLACMVDDFLYFQVIGAVGFMNQRLEIPTDVDARWASIIESCFQRFLT